MIIQINEKEAVIAAATQHPSLALNGGGVKPRWQETPPVILASAR